MSILFLKKKGLDFLILFVALTFLSLCSISLSSSRMEWSAIKRRTRSVIVSSAWKRLTIVAAGSSTDPPWFRHGNALSDRDTKGSMFLARLTLFLARRSKASRMNDEPWVDMARDFHRKRTGRGGWIVGTIGGELVDPRPVLNVDRFNRLFTK